MMRQMMTDLTLRSATSDDAPALLALAHAEEIVLYGEAETEADDLAHTLRWIGDLDTRTQVVEAGATLVAAALRTPDGGAQVTADPRQAADQRHAALEALTSWLVTEGTTELGVPAADEMALDIYERAGFSRTGASFELEAEVGDLVPVGLPQGLVLGHLDVADDAALREAHELVYERARWTDVPGHHHRPLDEWRVLHLGHDSYDPALQHVVRRDGRLIGVVFTRIYAGRWGWVSQLAVDVEERGTGIGRALLAHAAAALAACDGVESVGLSVEAANESALGLYRSIGMELDRSFVTLTR